ncbi:MAG: hypothetical protein MUP48_06440 [Wolbachia endosymbiont of Homalodisca vitripennis]|uniref:hypothetical protein n=1 Tax=Wolbachia endosymbiont of Rhagoletis cingulata TaxID=1220542 RepID=UPI001BC02A26|nr:hypothetical protein [Wolbachia endosymbiont of Homalodisca vitripennis]MCJ7455045.1 hypothetical protein [Wolbachia endosymbiont of Homalodisca vitripennis]MCJ7476454.1 hypothetical protein [Wolbachia endosymbiont of Homalodisca vitripennis]
MNINDFNIKNLTTISIVQEIKNGVRLVPDVIKPGIQGIFYAAGGVLFTYAYGFFAQQKSYEDGYMEGHMDGYNKGYREGYKEGSNQIAFIAGAACVGAAVGAAAAIYYTQCRQQNTQIANAQTNQVTSNNLALVE